MTPEQRSEKLIKRLKFLYENNPPFKREQELIKNVRDEYQEASKTLFIDSVSKEIDILENALRKIS
jgi:hypothetical protein